MLIFSVFWFYLTSLSGNSATYDSFPIFILECGRLMVRYQDRRTFLMTPDLHVHMDQSCKQTRTTLGPWMENFPESRGYTYSTQCQFFSVRNLLNLILSLGVVGHCCDHLRCHWPHRLAHFKHRVLQPTTSTSTSTTSTTTLTTTVNSTHLISSPALTTFCAKLNCL